MFPNNRDANWKWLRFSIRVSNMGDGERKSSFIMCAVCPNVPYMSAKTMPIGPIKYRPDTSDISTSPTTLRELNYSQGKYM